MLTVTKTIISTVLLSLLLAKANTVEARLKYYRYNAEIPMVEMSLNMMVAMGVLDQIPGRLVHDGNPYHTLATSRYRRSSRYPYAYPASTRYSSRYRHDDYWDEPLRRYSDYRDEPFGRYGDFWDEPFGYDDYWDLPRSYRRYSRSRFDYDPWYRRGGYWDSPWTDRWSSPGYSRWDSPWASRYGYPWYNTWASPWGSSWNNQWMNPWSSPYGYLGGWPYSSVYSTAPLSPDAVLDNTWPTVPYNSDNSSRQNNSNGSQGSEQPSWFGQPSKVGYSRGSNRADNRKTYRRLNGLWIGNNGEMLGIRGNRYLWYDDKNQYARGQLSKSPTMMKARVEGTNDVISYHYRLTGDELVIMSRDGKMRVFNRMPLSQQHRGIARPRAAYSSYRPESDTSYFSRSKFRSDLADEAALSVPDQSYPAITSPGAGWRSGAALSTGNLSSTVTTESNLHVPDVLSLPVDQSPAVSDSGDIGHVEDASLVQPAHDAAAAVPGATFSREFTSQQQSSAAYQGSSYYPQGALLSGNASDDDDTWKPLTPYSTYDAATNAPTGTIPVYQAYKSAAVTPESSRKVEPAAPDAAYTGIEADMQPFRVIEADKNDPQTYLYSYMKDSGNTYIPVAPRTWGNRNQMRPAFAYVAPNVTTKADSSNIWKPKSTFADSGFSPENPPSYYSAGDSHDTASGASSNAEVRKFTWSARSWN